MDRAALREREFATVVAAVERLAEDGNRLRFPASRALGDRLFELRVGLDVSRGGSRFTSPTTVGSFC